MPVVSFSSRDSPYFIPSIIFFSEPRYTLAWYDWKKCSCFAEQNGEIPMRILKPLIDPRDKTLLARDKYIARSSEPHAQQIYIFF